MQKLYYDEMLEKFHTLKRTEIFADKKIFLFGHCNATEVLIDLFLEEQISVTAILDNNPDKHGQNYRGIEIAKPDVILEESENKAVVCIASRAYEAMAGQLRRLGFSGNIYKMVDYNTFAEYSLSVETITRKEQRVLRGIEKITDFKERHPEYFLVLCPFAALGDIHITMSYLPHFLHRRGISRCVIGVVGNALKQVVQMFGTYPVEILGQKDMDEMIQAALYTKDNEVFIAHQDRPYIVNLHRALYIKCIPLEKIYCCGVFGLPEHTVPMKPKNYLEYPHIEKIEAGKTVILAPYAKSVPLLPEILWEQIANAYLQKGYRCFTNIAGAEEKPIRGTQGISPKIAELQSVVERAGVFIGLRSGLCDILKYANCRKVALYPDYNYSDTKWKAIDMYSLDGWENIVVKDDFQWTI